jgi:murein DD-endopeptidase MepM/ murein hydrolase activator NlpD
MMRKLVLIAIVLGAFMTASAAFSDSKTELLKINDQIVAKKQQIKDLQSRIKSSQDQIEALRAAEDNLENQIAILDNQLAKNLLDIEKTQAQIDEITLELASLDTQIAVNDARIASDRDLLAELIRRIAREDDRTALESLFLSDNLSAIFERAKSLSELQSDMLSAVKRLQQERAEQEQKRGERAAKNEELRKQNGQLKVDGVKIAETRAAKIQLMDATRNSESRYRDLMDTLRDEAASVSSDLTSLEAQARKRLTQNDRFPTGDVILSWPVPSRTITTVFRDPDYPFRRIMEHSAIDIGSTPQGTPIRAAAPGYILKARDAGYGYSYVIILHANGISTVYGHMSRITVTVDSYVERGEIIGYSGGMPGTRGAGSMTTGPHLHFEVRVNGIPTDPMDYLVN